MVNPVQWFGTADVARQLAPQFEARKPSLAPAGQPGAIGVLQTESDVATLDEIRRGLGRAAPVVALVRPQFNLSPAVAAHLTAVLTWPLTTPETPAAWQSLLDQGIAFLADALHGRTRPTMAAVHLPLGVTADGPLAELDDLAATQRQMPLVLANGVLLGDPVDDSPALGVTAFVVTDHDIAYARNLADDLAEAVWLKRTEFARPAMGADHARRRRPMAPFEPDTTWAGETFSDDR